jgi:hypothetical protein
MAKALELLQDQPAAAGMLQRFAAGNGLYRWCCFLLLLLQRVPPWARLWSCCETSLLLI